MQRTTETGNKTSIDFIVFCPHKLALGKPFDPCRFDDTHRVSGIIHRGCQLISAGTRCFKAEMDMIYALFMKPCSKKFKALLVVGKDLVFQFPIDEQCYVKLPFRNINRV